MGIRRGKDYIPRHGLPLSYYETALSLVEHDRLFMCTDVPSDPFIKYLQKRHHGIVRPPHALDNMAFISKFNKIVISNSTFLWWAAYLSHASQIICPRPQNGLWSKHDPLSKNIDLEIPDQQYSYVEAEQYSPEFLYERIQQIKDRTVQQAKHTLTTVFPFTKKTTTMPKRSFEED